MARARRTTKKAKPKKEKKPKPAKKAKAVKVEVAEEDAAEGPDMLPSALIVLTSIFLLVATILVWIQLGDLGAGPFK